MFLMFSVTALALGVGGIGEEKAAGFLIFIFSFSFSCFLVWYLNRAACVVWIEDDFVKRKGLFWGFYKEAPVIAIQSVVVQYVRGEGALIFLVDNSRHQFYRIRKNSYISLRKTKKNIAFIRSFWNRGIKKE